MKHTGICIRCMKDKDRFTMLKLHITEYTYPIVRTIFTAPARAPARPHSSSVRSHAREVRRNRRGTRARYRASRARSTERAHARRDARADAHTSAPMPRARATPRDHGAERGAQGEDPCAMGALLLLGACDAVAEGRGRARGRTAQARRGGSGDAAAAAAAAAAHRGKSASEETSERSRSGAEVKVNESAVKLTMGIKNADHRRLIYRWTNALVRAVGLKVPSGVGSIPLKNAKNKREKFDKFLVHYYGEESFSPGTYWYSNANAPAFFSEIFYIATNGRVRCNEDDIVQIFSKSDPSRQASTWMTSSESLERFGIARMEVLAIYCGEPRFEKGWPKGQPLHVPPPKIVASQRDGSLIDEAILKSAQTGDDFDSGAQLALKRQRTVNVSVVGVEPQVTPLGWKRQAVESVTKMRPLERQAIELCKHIEPSEANSPLMIMPLIYDQILRGTKCGGPRSRPCERNKVNKYYSKLLSSDVFLPEDVGAALKIKDSAVEVQELFRKFTNAFLKLKVVAADLDEASARRDSALSKLNGIMSALNTMEDTEQKTELEASVSAQRLNLHALELEVARLNVIVDSVVCEFDKLESATRQPYLNILRRCYELGSLVQNRIQKSIHASLDSCLTDIAACEVKGIGADADAMKTLFVRRNALQSLNATLRECKACFAFSLNTLDQRWEQFKPMYV